MLGSELCDLCGGSLGSTVHEERRWVWKAQEGLDMELTRDREAKRLEQCSREERGKTNQGCSRRKEKRMDFSNGGMFII
jgi:hypothetical protein